MSDKLLEARYCCYCEEQKDLRPYGPRGAMVCFDCAMSTPDREAETERNFVVQLNACGNCAVIDGSNAGPYPVEHSIVALLQALRGDPA